MKRMQDDGIDIELPPCDALHVANLLFDIGPVVPAGMGMAAIGHADIQAFQNNTGIELDVWTVRTLRRLSQEYQAQSARAESRDCLPPYREETTTDNTRQAVHNKIRTLIGNSHVHRG